MSYKIKKVIIAAGCLLAYFLLFAAVAVVIAFFTGAVYALWLTIS